MKTIKRIALCIWSLLLVPVLINAQVELDCDPNSDEPTQGEVFFSYGSAINSFSFKNKTSYTIGQPVIGGALDQENTMQFGYWARLIAPPYTPGITVSQGDFPDRNLIEWYIDPLSPEADDGYVIQRDGAFLGTVGEEISQFIDFNVQPGEVYEYSVFGKNQYGNGGKASAIGFVNPNGLVSGTVSTLNGNPVPGVTVALSPNSGSSLNFDGVDDKVCITYNEAFLMDKVTVSAFVKIGDGDDDRAIVDLGSEVNNNFWIHTSDGASGKGVTVAVGDGSTSYEIDHTFASDPDEWHQVTMVYGGGQLILYIDGAFVTTAMATMASTPYKLSIGNNDSGTQPYDGLIDDVRIFNRTLTSSDIFLNQDKSPSRNSEGLVAYFKMDEGTGANVFDLSANKLKGKIFGAAFDEDAAPVMNVGTTDESGGYIISGVNYSGDGNFTATPSKNFYYNAALEFNKANNGYADLTDFDLPDTFTVELTVHPFNTVDRQSILSYGSTDFNLYLDNGNYYLEIGGSDQLLGPAAMEYQHIAVTMINGSAAYYLNGSLANTLSYSTSNDFTGDKWRLGATGSTPSDFYTGLIDDVAFFNDVLPIQTIQLHASELSNGVDIGEGNLISYFSLNEAKVNELEDTGANQSGFGMGNNVSSSVICYRQEVSPHIFRPASRAVVISASNTALSGIDFTDESTVPVSGVIRFDGTFCFHDSVEILVNGDRYAPPIFTDSVGRFVADFEPGASVSLTPKFGSEDKEHKFSPPFYEVRNLVRPVASVLFTNQTKRKITGRISGGDGRLAANNPDDIVKMKVAAQNQCFEREITVEDDQGNFEFVSLPAVKFTTAMTFNQNNIIYDYMQELGGQVSDMRDKEIDTLDFRYYVLPQVWVEEFDPGLCPSGDTLPFPYIEESGPDNGFRLYEKTLRMYEDYAGGRDWLDQYDLVVTNNLNDESPDTIQVRDTTAYLHEFAAGQANIGGDFTKFFQVEGISARGENDVFIENVVVVGEREREASFATKAPVFPLLILRDPPGDGSSATWEKGKTYCTTWSAVAGLTAAGSYSESLKLGGDIEFSAGLGFEKTTKIELENTSTVTASFESSLNTTRESNLCMTSNQTISTSDSDAVIGDGGDLYYGAALNVKFSGNDVLYLDTNTCSFRSDSVTVSVAPVGFDTEYIYSDWQIRTSVISNLELTGDTVSANAWRNILAYNDGLKTGGVYDKNISFDGLASYGESTEVEQSDSRSFEFAIESTLEFSNEFGLEFDGIGYTNTFTASLGASLSASTTSSNTETSSISYTLEDDDPNDSYSVDIINDPVMGTPMFRLIAGESMCPWIPGTLNREEIGFQIDRLTAVNVPENEAAVFNVTMSNLGQTGNDPLIYILGLKQGSNLGGAVVTVDGEALINPIPIQLQPGESKTFVIAVEKGPDVNVYNYNNIGLFAASECQYDHALGLGYNLAGYADWEVNNPGEPVPQESDNVIEGIYNIVDLQKFYKQFLINVEFQEPCSRVDIGFPLQDWVQTPAMGENMSINLNNYNSTDPELDLIRVQYRRTGGDGAWINITDVPKDSLDNPIFHSVSWDMAELADGPYEVRALALCTSGLNAGISTVIQGRKETKPPQIFGTPQPADGILSPGDEISIEFTKRINCDMVFQADGIGSNINLNNIALQDMTLGGVLVDATITCKDEKIFIVPNIAPRFIENHTLRATATGIQDLYGNASEQVSWEFYVNQSNLYWVGGDVDEVVLEGETRSITREIRNQSGQNTNFEIYDIPDWADVFPSTGSLIPGASTPVTISFPDDLVISPYETTLQLSETVGSSTTPMDGNEPLNMDLRVTCPAPNWSVDASDYSFSMNFVLELDIEGELSTDKVDMVGAFIDNELRGVANVEYDRNIDKYLAFLTVYSNQAGGEMVDFQIWDASICQLFANIVEVFPYTADGLVGTPNNTQVIHTDGQILKKIDIHPGWNWISFNLDFVNASVNSAIESLSNPSGALIKDQTTFASYSDAGQSWFGSLDSLGYESLYQYNSLAYDSISMIGLTMDPSTEIPLNTGWNWIGFLPQIGLPIDAALASLNPQNGDVIKSQVSFAVYVAGAGWIGNLNFLSPPNGYLINLAAVDTLSYPNISGLVDEEIDATFLVTQDDFNTKTIVDQLTKSEMPFDHWQVDPTIFEFSMNSVGIVLDEDDSRILEEGDEIGAFIDGEIRGSGKVIYIPTTDEYMAFITTYANQEGELISYKMYDASTSEEFGLAETKTFAVNKVVGNVDVPFEWHMDIASDVSDLDNLNFVMKVMPNPFSKSLNITVNSTESLEKQLIVTNVLGKIVYSNSIQLHSGVNNIEWTPDSNVANGVYQISIKDANEVWSEKVLYLK